MSDPASLLRKPLTEAASGYLESATFRLAAGSAILYVSGLFLLGSSSAILLVLFVPVALVFHATAWFALRAEAARDPTGAMGFLFGLSVLGFILGIVTAPLQFPAGRASGWVLEIALLPFIPYVWGPVVLAHAAMFLWKNAALAPRPIRLLGEIGVAFLIGTAALGLLGQTAAGLGLRAALAAQFGNEAAAWTLEWIFMPMPAGLTAIGYAMEYVAWIAVSSGWGSRRRPRSAAVAAP